MAFLDCEYLTDEQYDIALKIKEQGRKLVFFHAPAYASENALSWERTKRLAGGETYETPRWLEADELRGIYKKAGVHVYTDEDVVLSANRAWLMLHTSHDGEYRISLPRKARKVTETTTEKTAAENACAFTWRLPKHATAVFLVEYDGAGSGASAIRLAADADWSAFGTVALKDGSTLDLNGHRLTVRDIVCDDYLGVCITNTAAKKAVLLFTGEPTESKAYSDGAIKEVNSKILLAKAGERAAIWIGAAGDGNALDENNWQDMLTEEPVVPTAGHAVKIIDGSTVAMQIPSGSPFVCKSFDVGSCTFTAPDTRLFLLSDE